MRHRIPSFSTARYKSLPLCVAAPDMEKNVKSLILARVSELDTFIIRPPCSPARPGLPAVHASRYRSEPMQRRCHPISTQLTVLVGLFFPPFPPVGPFVVHLRAFGRRLPAWKRRVPLVVHESAVHSFRLWSERSLHR